MLSYAVHYRNKYPGGQVQVSENSIDVYDAKGEHRVALRKNGAGQWQDDSEKFGCSDRHDLSPIPKDSRLFKIVAGSIAKDELHEERKAMLGDFTDASGRVMSCEELKVKKFSFDDKQRVVSKPAKA